MTSIPFRMFPCAGCEPFSNAPSCRPGCHSILWELGAQHLFYARYAWNLSGILWEPLCLGHAKAKTPRLRAKLSRRRTGWAAGSKLRRIAGCVASRGGWHLSGSHCSNDYHFSRLHLSSSAVAASSWYSYRWCHFESEKNLKTHGAGWRYHDTCFLYSDNVA